MPILHRNDTTNNATTLLDGENLALKIKCLMQLHYKSSTIAMQYICKEKERKVYTIYSLSFIYSSVENFVFLLYTRKAILKKKISFF